MEKGFSSGPVQAWFRAALAETKRLRSTVGAGLLAALGIILKPMSVYLVPNLLRLSFAFLPTALSGYLYGPFVAGFAAMVVDVLGYLVKPDGAFFFGYTLNAFVNGFIYGCWLYRHKISIWRTLCACLTSMLCVSFVLNPLWLSMLNGEAWLALVLLRVPTNALLLPVNTGLLYAMLRVVNRYRPGAAYRAAR